MNEAYRGPYLKRAGEAAATMVELLADRPKYELQEGTRQEVYAFEHGLFDERLEAGEDSPETIGDVMRAALSEDQEAPFFFAEYFMNGDIDLGFLHEVARRNGATIEQPPQFTSPHEVYEWIAELIQNREQYGLTNKDLLSLGKKSAEYYKQQFTNAVVAGQKASNIHPLIAEAMPLVVDPVKTLDQLHKLQKVRHILVERRQQHAEIPDPRTEEDRAHNARRAILGVYLSKVNAQVADYIPRAFYLYDQAVLSDEADLRHAAIAAVPAAFRNAFKDDASRASAYKRLDFIRNGIDARSATAVNAQGQAERHPANGVARRLWNLRGNTPEASEHTEAHFSAEDAEAFKAFKISPEKARELIDEIFARLSMLSAEPHSSYYVGRTTWAADDRWQTVINPEKASYAVDSIGGVYKVPSVETNLFALITTGGLHEFQHVWQAMADKRIGTALKIAAIKGKRVSMLREGGANAKQRAGTLDLFGISAQAAPNMTYARARIALDNGEGPIAAAYAFYEEKMSLTPTANPADTAMLAADRVLRLRRHGGANSQPMSYAEEWLMIDELAKADQSVAARATQVTCLDLADQVRLHAYGLLPGMHNGQNPDVVPALLEVLEPLMYEAHTRYTSSFGL